jgi:hypothetical protein
METQFIGTPQQNKFEGIINCKAQKSIYNSSYVINPWQGKMDHLRDYIAEKGMLDPGPGG